MRAYKEIRPVNYNDNGISHHTSSWKPGQEAFSSHWHDRLEILFIVQGELHIEIDEEFYVATPNQTVIISPLMKHYGVAGNEGVIYEVITFDISKFVNTSPASKEYLSSFTEQKNIFYPITNHSDIASALKTLLAYLEAGKNLNPLCSIGKLYELIGLFYQHCIKDTAPRTNMDETFSEVLEYIKSNFLENISTKDISKKFGYDNTYFCRKFKTVTGMTVMKYIRYLKLEIAKDLLEHSNDSIKDISWKCGFADISHLSNSFKHRFKMSPTEYRKKKKR